MPRERNPNIPISDADLYSYYVKEKKDGRNRAEIAAKLNISQNVLRWKIYKIKEGLKRGVQPSNDPPESDPVSSESVKVRSQDNYLEIEANRKRIVSLDDLLAAANVDLEVWKVDRYIINKWEVGAKTARRQIEWKDGQIVEGFLDDPGKLEVEPLFQIKIYLIRRIPVEITPVIKPIEITISNVQPEFVKSNIRYNEFKRALIVPDIQVGFSRDLFTNSIDPFHDRRALDIVLQFAQLFSFDKIVFLGDLLDLPDWTDKFIRSPAFYFNTQPAVIELSWWLSKFRAAAPSAEIYALEGNHDLRMTTALQAHLNAAYQLRPADEISLPPSLSVERLLSLSSLDIKYIAGYPDNEVWLNDRLRLIHGSIVRSNPGETAKAVVADSDVSTIFGHIHRIERAARTIINRNGSRTITALSPGCLCRLDSVVPGNTKNQDWQQGFAIVTYNDTSNKEFASIDAIEIQDGMTVYAGEVFESRESLEQLRAETNWNF